MTINYNFWTDSVKYDDINVCLLLHYYRVFVKY